jgi:hypothetical protein
LLVGENVAGRDEDVVCADALPSVGEPEGVVESEGGLVVSEAVEVPVCLFVSDFIPSFFFFLCFRDLI